MAELLGLKGEGRFWACLGGPATKRPAPASAPLLCPLMKQPAIFNWSGGKDSALALYEVLQGGQYEVKTLLTTLSAPYQRISMHGVRAALLDRQAASLGLPCRKLFLPEMRW